MRIFKNQILDEEFHRYGYVVVNLLDDAEVRELTAIHQRHPAPSDIPRSVVASFITDNIAYRQAVQREIKQVLDRRVDEMLLDYRIFHATFISKLPRLGNSMDLHLDAMYVDEHEHANFNVWCPLVEVGPDNGWLYIVAGTHRFNKGFRLGGMPYPHLYQLMKKRFLTFLPLRPGQAVFFHPRALHGSPANRTDEMRHVVVGSIVPRTCTRFHICHPAPERGQHMLDVFEVEEDYFFQYRFGQHPTNPRAHMVMTAPPEPLDIRLLTETCAELVRKPTDPAIVHGIQVGPVPARAAFV